MSQPSRADLMAIRHANKQALQGVAGNRRSSHAYTPAEHFIGGGMNGMGDITSLISQAVQGVRFTSAFPAVDYTYVPGAAAPVDNSAVNADGSTSLQAASGVGTWILAHVVRPTISVTTPAGAVTIDPYSSEADYSGLVKVGAVAAALGSLWLLYRALGGD